MNELLAHRNYVLHHPAERTAALSLADHEQERGAPSRFAALRTVAVLRRQLARTAELQCAAHFMSRTSPGRVVMLALICRATGITADGRVKVIVKEGRAAPRMTDRGGHKGGWLPAAATVTVGARWILSTQRIIETEVNPPLTIGAGTWPAE